MEKIPRVPGDQDQIEKKKQEIKKKLLEKLDKEDRIEKDRVSKQKQRDIRFIEEDDIKKPHPVTSEREKNKVPVKLDHRTVIWVIKDKCVQLPNKDWIKKVDAVKSGGEWSSKKK